MKSKVTSHSSLEYHYYTILKIFFTSLRIIEHLFSFQWTMIAVSHQHLNLNEQSSSHSSLDISVIIQTRVMQPNNHHYRHSVVIIVTGYSLYFCNVYINLVSNNSRVKNSHKLWLCFQDYASPKMPHKNVYILVDISKINTIAWRTKICKKQESNH